MAEKRRLTPRGTQRRAQLIAFATKTFAAEGYHPTSVADIVDGLGVGKGVFYWYFDSKEMLFEEILREAQTELRRTQQRAVADLDDPIEQMAQGIRAAVAWTAANPDLANLFDFAHTDERFAARITRGRAELVKDAVPLLNRAIEQERIPRANSEHLAHAILGVTTSLTTVYIHQLRQDPDAIADAVVSFCLGGIGVGQQASIPVSTAKR